jgi:hypothetical protein
MVQQTRVAAGMPAATEPPAPPDNSLHTVAHLAADAMIASFPAWKLVDWARLRG